VLVIGLCLHMEIAVQLLSSYERRSLIS
jgi:hypothetical protein